MYLEIVALRKESVDRNAPDWAEIARREASLSARRAWIEMTLPAGFQVGNATVALRKESVDRNVIGQAKTEVIIVVALRKESVDRNLCAAVVQPLRRSRSPQGERG